MRKTTYQRFKQNKLMNMNPTQKEGKKRIATDIYSYSKGIQTGGGMVMAGFNLTEWMTDE